MSDRMLNHRQWMKMQREGWARKVSTEVDVLCRLYDRHDEHERKQLEEEIDKVLAANPEPQYKVRTRSWWIRWGLVTVVNYVAIAWLAYRFNHPELSGTQVFLGFWDAMTWR